MNHCLPWQNPGGVVYYIVLRPHFTWNCGFTRLSHKRLAACGLDSQNTHYPQIHLAYLWGFVFQASPVRLFRNPKLVNGLHHHYRYSKWHAGRYEFKGAAAKHVYTESRVPLTTSGDLLPVE